MIDIYEIKPLGVEYFKEVFMNHPVLQANPLLHCYDMTMNGKHIGHIAVQESTGDDKRLATIHIHVLPECRSKDAKQAVTAMCCDDLPAMLKDQGYDMMVANCTEDAKGVIELMERAGMTVNKLVIGVLHLT